MKLFAQHGYGDGNKINEGLERGYIQGVIFRPRDIGRDRIFERCNEIRNKYSGAEIYFDPQYYGGVLYSRVNVKLGKLEEYTDYFNRVILSELETESNIKNVLENTYNFVTQLNIDGVIAPNIVIRRSFDSRESVISKNFIRYTKSQLTGVDKPVFATLAVSRDALTNSEELNEFLNDITTLQNPPDGFYILVNTNSVDSRSEIYNADVIAAWLFLNYSLNVNGFKVINGYSDIVSAFLGSVGGYAGATGWWSNMRTFSLDQFLELSSGGRLPVQRYLSKALLNRLRFDEYHAWRQFVPEIQNGLESDKIFEEDETEPDRSEEVFQSWESISSLISELGGDENDVGLDKVNALVRNAVNLYDRIESSGFSPHQNSNREHLEPILEGIEIFKKWAEI